MENKKTYLYLKTIELGSKEDKSSLVNLMQSNTVSDDEKIEQVKSLFINSGASSATQDAVKEYTDKAFGVLEELNISKEKKQLLRGFGQQLMNRRV